MKVDRSGKGKASGGLGWSNWARGWTTALALQSVLSHPATAQNSSESAKLGARRLTPWYPSSQHLLPEPKGRACKFLPCGKGWLVGALKLPTPNKPQASCSGYQSQNQAIAYPITAQQQAYLDDVWSDPLLVNSERYQFLHHEISLFGAKEKPLVEHIKEQGLEDCYFLAALAAVVHRFPCHLRQSIIHHQLSFEDRRLQSFQVRMYLASSSSLERMPLWIHVNAMFPETSHAEIPMDPFLRRAIVYPVVMEKAFAKFTSVVDVVGQQGYFSLGQGGAHEGLGALLPQGALTLDLDQLNIQHNKNHAYYLDSFRSIMKAMESNLSVGLIGTTRDSLTALAQGALYVGEHVKQCKNYLAFQDGSVYGFAQQQIVAKTSQGSYVAIVLRHAYTVLHVDPEGNVVLRNPWGLNTLPHPDRLPEDLRQALGDGLFRDGGQTLPSTFQLPYRDVLRLFHFFSWSVPDPKLAAAELSPSCA